MLNSFYKLYLKLNKSAYKNKLLYWCKKNQKKNIVLITFDCETQRDMDVLDKLHKKLSDIKLTPYFAVPGELIEKNKLLIQNLSKKKCFFINHGYKIHTVYDHLKKKNFSSFSYNNMAKSLIAEDIIKGHNSIKKITGQIPDIFRTPHFGSYSNKNSMNFIYDILFDLGYKFSSSTTPIYSFSKAPFYETNNIIEVPISSCLNKPLQIIDSWAFIGSKDKIEITGLIDEMNKYFILMETNTFFLNTYFDPSDIINYDIFFETLSKFTKWSVNDFGQINDKETKKILLISYCLPPDPYPESYVTAKIISKLTNFFEIDILTSTQKRSTLTKDYSLDSYFNKKVNITTIFPSKITDFFLSLSRFPLRPDRWILMYMKMIKKLNSMKLDRYDYFFTRSQFHSSHLIGLYLKKKFPKKKWITSFSDPWSNNKYQKKIPLLDLISKALENEVKKKSDLLIFPLNKLKENFIENPNKIENKKTLIIPHTIDRSLYLNKIKKNKKFTIRFFGKIYGDRNIIPFVNALRIILKENKNIIVEFYTRKDSIFEYLAKDKFLKRYLKFKPYEGYLKALNIMENSDLLLIFDSDNSKNSIFFQSKVLDYIGSKSRILHIGNYNTINKKLTIESNGLEAKNELNSILNKLKLAIKEKEDFRFNSDLLSQYDSKKIANKLYKRIIRLD